MTSLSQQLKSINEKTASVALDRKSRSKIHSKSLIFSPKIASTQDYDYIYNIGLEGLEELCEIDSRFHKFKQTLFSETSINIDRNVQDQDTEKQLNQSINAFLSLIGPYYLLNSTIKALEWLVRRFYINIHNSEMLLLTVLPYHTNQIFTKILNIIAKQQLPKLFEWLSGYKDLLQSPPASSIIKAFHNDADLFKFFSMYLLENLDNGVVYKQQLVFYLSNTVQLLASLSKKLSVLNEIHMPIILEIIGKLLLSYENKYSKSIQTDLRLTAYSLIAVIGSIIPLTSNLIVSITSSILQDESSFDSNTSKQTLIVLGQLWNYYNEPFEKVYCLTEIKFDILLKEIPALIEENYKLNKFIQFYFFSNLPNENSYAIFKLIDLNNSKTFISAVVKQIVEQSVSKDDSLIAITEALIKYNKDLFVEELEVNSLKIEELEMRLMTTLSANNDVELEAEEDVDEIIEEEDPLKVNIQVKSKSSSFFDSATNNEFNSLSLELNNLLKSADIKAQKLIILSFLNSVFISNEAAVSFIIRLSFTPSVPLVVRLSALRVIKFQLKKASSGLVDTYLLLPIFILGLSDEIKAIRAANLQIVKNIIDNTNKIHQGKKNVKTSLFMEEQIYNSVSAKERAIIPPHDALALGESLISEANLDDILLDNRRVNHILFEIVFKSSQSGLKKIGQLLFKTFILNQWSLEFLPIVFKWKIWSILAQQNDVGCDDRAFFFESDVNGFINKRDNWLVQANDSKIEFYDVEKALVSIVGGETTNDKIASKEVDWFIQSLSSSSGSLQIAVNDRIIKVFSSIKSNDNKLKLVNKFLDLLVNDEFVEVDQTLQSLEIDHDIFISVLANVQIGSQIPEQGLAKRRRRSSNSTKIALARDDINNMASIHLKKLTFILDILENTLRKKTKDIAKSDLLQALFKILTDLDYLGNDGNLPVLYTQETLASCMLLCILKMKESNVHTKLDSNSLRADLIVNSLRSSTSPQVQNRLLLVIAEFATLAPEIVLHSVMPIFTFMGAHTVKQDDEFSNFALQQTISKVIPALATNGTTDLSNEIEFLLTSFVAAFQHIPRHRRVNLFISLTKTLGYETSLPVLLFLMGQQYVNSCLRNKLVDAETVLEFTRSFMKSFSAKEQLQGIAGFTKLWSQIPVVELDPKSEEYKTLNSRSIFGTSILSLDEDGLSSTKAQLLKFLRSSLEEEFAKKQSLKLKVAVILFDDSSNEAEKKDVMSSFTSITSFILSCLDTFTNVNEKDNITINLYELLAVFLDILPLNYFFNAIVETLQPEKITDGLSMKIAKNYTTLAGRKVDNELNSGTIDEDIENVIIGKFIPVLINGFNGNLNVELEQSYLDTFSTIVTKFGSSSQDFNNTTNSKVLIGALTALTNNLTSEQPELIISSINAISSIISVLGVKIIGFFPKIVPPALKIHEQTLKEDDDETNKLIQTSIIILFSSLIKKIPAFMTTSLDSIFLCILNCDLVDNSIRLGAMNLIVDHVDASHVLKSLSNIWYNKEFYKTENVEDLGLYLNIMQVVIDRIDKKSASSQAVNFIKWLIQVFEFRSYIEPKGTFDNNTIYRLESSFHQCGIAFVMKLNDKNFRPLFANLVRWAIDGEGSYFQQSNENTRLIAFFRYFHKLQDQLKGIITSYFSYLLDPVAKILNTFIEEGDKANIQLKRIVFDSLTSSFKYDQDDYWSQQGRFESICDPLLNQLSVIESTIGKYLVKAITALVANVASEEYNGILVNGLIKYIANDNEGTNSTTKTWTIRIIKNVFQKMGDQWLSFLPTLIPYIAELLEDDDEAVELEVRHGLVKVIENVLGEPLDRYLS